MANIPESGKKLFSTVTEDNQLHLALKTVPVARPEDHEVLIRVEAAPINPSDLGLMFSVADLAQLKSGKDSVSAPIPPQFASAVDLRRSLELPTGNEGAGTVIAAGASAASQALLGKKVSVAGGSMYAQYRIADAESCLVLPDGISAEAGASSYINPMTALGMVATMRSEGFSALIHTAAASNLGQMLVRLTEAEGIELVNIVRSDEQVAMLRSIGARHAVNSTSPEFTAELKAAIVETGAFLAFDAIGGGRLADRILHGMEAAALEKNPGFSRYGTSQRKQVYIYGGLDTGPTEITRGFGMAWGVGGWLLPNFLQTRQAQEIAGFRKYVGEHLGDIFASHYSDRIALEDVVKTDVISRYSRRATRQKFLITP